MMRLSWAFFCVVAVSVPLFAQELLKRPVDPRSSSEKASEVQDKAFDPSQATNLSSPSLRFSLIGTREDALVKAGIGIQRGNVLWDAKFSGPIGKKDSEATLVDLDGLPNQASADFGITFLKWSPRANVQKQDDICAKFLVDSKKARDDEEARKMIKPASGAGKAGCGLTDLRVAPAAHNAYVNAVEWKTPKYFTARFKVGRREYEFARSPEFADEKAPMNSYSGVAAAGVLTERFGLFQAGWEYQSSYKEQDSSDICTPLPSSTSTRCREIAVGAPVRNIKSLIQAETRKFVGDKFGIGTRFNYDTRSTGWSVSMPVFAFKNKEGGFNGGVAWGVVSKITPADAIKGTLTRGRPASLSTCL